MIDKLVPAPLEIQHKDDLANPKKECNFCGHETIREFCSGRCETKAAFASIGKSLKFHE